MQQSKFKDNVILIDADLVDGVAWNLSTNFEKMLCRDIKDVDLATWLVCVALDGGVPEGKNEIQCIFIHSKEKLMLEQFYPAHLEKEIDGTAFMDDALGEFMMSTLPVESVSSDDFFVQCTETLLDASEVKRLIIIPEMIGCGSLLSKVLEKKPEGKRVTMLTMNPADVLPGTEHVVLGYSLMHAMGIKAEEI